MADLSGRVALVTGAARGQGAAIALMLARHGATVVATDICSSIDSVPYPLATDDDLRSTVRAIRDTGGDASAVRMDVRDRQQVNEVVADALARHGRIDVLVASAGICAFAALDDVSESLWNDTVETNLTGAYNVIQEVVPAMTRQGFGRIVTIASGAGRMGIADLSHYAASKWGLIGFTKSVAVETSGQGITANVVAPTAVGTPMILNRNALERHFPDTPDATFEDLHRKFSAENPMGKPWLLPDDVARAVEWLVLDPGVTSGTVVEVNLATSAART